MQQAINRLLTYEESGEYVFRESPINDMPTNGTWSVGFERGTIVARIPSPWKENVSKSTGYIYVLKDQEFVGNEGSWQMKCHNPVVPVEIIPVRFQEYSKLGGEVYWIE